MAARMTIPRTFMLALLLITGCALLLSVYWKLPLELSLLALVVLGVLLNLIVRFPEWFLVAALFAPQWKTLWIFRSLERFADLTVAMLVCLAAGLAWRALTRFRHSNYWGFRKIFLGQLNQILAFLVFAAIVTASYFHTTAPNYGASKLGRFLSIGTLLLIAPFLLILTEADLRRFARIFVGFSTATAIQLISSLEMRTRDASDDITRIGAGWLIGMGIILVLFYPLSRSRRGQRALFLFMLPLLIVGLMASASRGPMVSLSVAVLIGLATWVRQGRVRTSTAAALLLLFVVGASGAYFALRQADLDKYTAKAGELKLLFTEGAASGTAAKRLTFYRSTLAAIPDHPLLGTGIGSWSTFYYGSDQRNYPHNLFLEIAFEEGLLGFAAFLILLLLVGVSAVRMLIVSRSYFLAPGLMVLYCVLVSSFSGDLDDNRVLWLWIGVTLSLCRTVQLHLNARRFVLRDSRQLHDDMPFSSGVQAFSGHFVVGGHSIPKRGHTWHEKFV
jgi:O-antigen ligase